MVDELSPKELQHIAWKQLGVRVSANASPEQIHELLRYELEPEDLPHNPVNDLRDTLISFIEKHRDNLSLPCNGNCYEHEDGVVTFCFRQYKEDTSA